MKTLSGTYRRVIQTDFVNTKNFFIIIELLEYTGLFIKINFS